MPEAKNRELTLIVTAAILAAFAVVDYATPATLANRVESIQALALGVCIAQLTLIAIWAVFAPGNIVVRLPWALLLGLAMWYLLAFGARHASRHSLNQDGIRVLGIALLVSLCLLQIPLWIAKQRFRYRMLAPEKAIPMEPKPLQFQLKHLLVGTFIIAVGLSPIRLVLGEGKMQGPMLPMGLIVGIPTIIAVNLAITLPCLWGGFVAKQRAIRVVLDWMVYSLSVTGVAYAILCTVWGERFSERLDWLRNYCLLNVTQGLVVFAVMRIFRTLGFRLERVPRDAR